MFTRSSYSKGKIHFPRKNCVKRCDWPLFFLFTTCTNQVPSSTMKIDFQRKLRDGLNLLQEKVVEGLLLLKIHKIL